VDVLSSRILLRPSSLDRSRASTVACWAWASAGSSAPPDDRGLVFFPGQGLLEVSGHAAGPPGRSVLTWIRVRDVHAGHVRLAAAGVPIVSEPAAEPWGLIEMRIEDPDGVRIVLVGVPADHTLAATRGRRYRCDGDPQAAYQRVRRKMQRPSARPVGGMRVSRAHPHGSDSGDLGVPPLLPVIRARTTVAAAPDCD
jgi:glyoxalase/bleomycin resistance protein/dioxygenase superfamily protein